MESKKKFQFKAEWKWAYLFISPMVIGTLIFGIILFLFCRSIVTEVGWHGGGRFCRLTKFF